MVRGRPSAAGSPGCLAQAAAASWRWPSWAPRTQARARSSHSWLAPKGYVVFRVAGSACPHVSLHWHDAYKHRPSMCAHIFNHSGQVHVNKPRPAAQTRPALRHGPNSHRGSTAATQAHRTRTLTRTSRLRLCTTKARGQCAVRTRLPRAASTAACASSTPAAPCGARRSGKCG